MQTHAGEDSIDRGGRDREWRFLVGCHARNLERCVPGLGSITVQQRGGDVGADEPRDAGGCGGGEVARDVAGSGAEVEDEREGS